MKQSQVIIVAEAIGGRARGVAIRALMISFAIGWLLALSTSGGILLERLSFGSPRVALAVGCAMAITAWLQLVHTRHTLAFAFRLSRGASEPPPALFSADEGWNETVYRLRTQLAIGAQALGAVAGIWMVHTVTSAGHFVLAPWLTARAELLVNDGVAAVSLLVFVWALAMDHDTFLLLGVLCLLTLFSATAERWSVDGARHLFGITVQRALVAQFGAIALVFIGFPMNILRDHDTS